MLRFDNVTIDYAVREGLVRTVHGVSFTVPAGQVTALIGESGSGKSTLTGSVLRILPRNARIHPQSHVWFGDEDVLSMDSARLQAFRWRRASMVFQAAQNALSPTLRIRTQMLDSATDHGVTVRPERLAELLEMVRLEPRRVLNVYPHELSGGMRQRVLIALSMVLEPEFIVLDEPTTALDVITQNYILDILADVHRRTGLTMLFISHDMAAVARLSDRIGVMYAGTLVELGTTRQMLDAPRHPYTIGLLQSVPSAQGARPIPGHPPDLLNRPSGCVFHPRCPRADQRCHTEVPTAQGDDPVACHHAAVAMAPAQSVTEIKPPTSPATAAEEVVGLHRVELHYGKLQACAGVDLSVRSGDIVTIVGESGCGKSTVGRLLLALERPTAGQVRYFGKDVWAKGYTWQRAVRRAVQVVHQDSYASLNPRRTVMQTLQAPLGYSRAQVLQLLEQVGLMPAEYFASKWPFQMSGGQRQRVSIARAMMMSPRLIVADEPVSGVDASLRLAILDLMRRLNEEQGIAFVYITHDLLSARYFGRSGRLVVMYLGRIVEEGPALEVLDHPRHPYLQALLGQADLRSVEMPDPTRPPPGCAFNPRCPLVGDNCLVTVPSLRGEIHRVACHVRGENS